MRPDSHCLCCTWHIYSRYTRLRLWTSGGLAQHIYESVMKTSSCIVLLALETSAVLAACNADNVLRALRNNAANASPFCSTYTNQPLPTYISQYPASRISSACSCLITPSPTPTSTPGSSQCRGELIRNGGFRTLANGDVPPWEYPFACCPNNGHDTNTCIVTSARGNKYA